MPLATDLSSTGLSAQPKSVCFWATCLTVLPEPLPGRIFRSMPSAE